MIADLHCHYAMHLLPEDRHPHGEVTSWWERLRDEFQAGALDVLAGALNEPGWGSRWRVDLNGLEQGGARTVCSVLYWPYAEFDLDRSYGSGPESGYFAELQHQLTAVEQDLRDQDPDYSRHTIARRGTDLDDSERRVTFVHCVEGGFHLGPDLDAIDANVRWLADKGVVYITLAHLFFRGVAANAPAIPKLSDEQYNLVFHQDERVGLTELGRAVVRAMYKHRVLIDISHMRQDAIDDTFALLDQLDSERGAAPGDFPVIASHVGHRQAGPHEQAYNLTDDTLQRVKQRGGLVGLLMAQHQLGSTASAEDSRRVLRRHIDRIHDAVGSHELTAIGSDLDGFIKPTLTGIERASDLATLEQWIREDYPDAGSAILSSNAIRVLQSVLG